MIGAIRKTAKEDKECAFDLEDMLAEMEADDSGDVKRKSDRSAIWNEFYCFEVAYLCADWVNSIAGEKRIIGDVRC